MENNNINSNPANDNDNNNVHFSADEKITIVSSTQKNNSSKKLPIIMSICVIVVALVVGIIVFVMQANENAKDPDNSVVEHSSEASDPLEDFYNQILEETITDTSGNEISREEYITQIQQQIQEATTVLSQQVGVTSPNQIIIDSDISDSNETTTSANDGNETTTANINTGETTTANIQQTENAEAQIKAFLNRSCYIQGALYSGNVGDPLSMSFDGDNFEVLTNIDGTEISLMSLNGTMYMKRPALNQYVELTDTVLNTLGIDVTEFDFRFATSDYESMKSKLKGVYDISINGNPGVCYEYKTEEQTFRFYSEDGNLRQIEIYDADGTLVSQIAISYFSESIPGDQMTLKGYTKTGFGTMFADMM